MKLATEIKTFPQSECRFVFIDRFVGWISAKGILHRNILLWSSSNNHPSRGWIFVCLGVLFVNSKSECPFQYLKIEEKKGKKTQTEKINLLVEGKFVGCISSEALNLPHFLPLCTVLFS